MSCSSLLRLLTIETGGSAVYVAVAQRETIAHAWQHWAITQEGGSKASATLLPAISEALAQAKIELAELDAIAFGQGPGSFTGVRTACAVAQGLAISAKAPSFLPLIPVCSLRTLAQSALSSIKPMSSSVTIWSCLDARMGQIYAASYVCNQGLCASLTEPQVYEPVALWQKLSASKTIVVGNAKALIEPFYASQQGFSFEAFFETEPNAIDMIEVAQEQWQQGAVVSPEQAQPLYVRNKVAFTQLERQAMASALSA